MLTTLLESSAVAPRRRVSSVVSLALHIGACAALAVASANANSVTKPSYDDVLVYVAPPPEPAQVSLPTDPVPASSSSAFTASHAPVPALAPLAAPDIVPMTLPDIDLSRAVVSADDFSRTSSPVGTGTDKDARGSVFSGGGDVWSSAMVEKPVATRPGSPSPLYPEMLRSSGIAGEVRARFVVDSTGRVDPARIEIVSSDHTLFTRSVESGLRRMRYIPAEVGGRRVAQLVEQTFAFTLDR